MNLAFIGLAVLGVTGSALAEPTYHRVTGVAADDVLNIRAEPRATSADIGDLAQDAKRIEVFGFDASGNWAHIARNGRDGWIATRFLARDKVATLADSTVPIGLVCGGTEPFWALALHGAEARYSHPADGDTDFALDTVDVAEGHRGSPALITASADTNEVIEATITGATCTDGMSDRDYGWLVTMQLRKPGQQRFLKGCCHLPPD
ncbi:SH3 domain-containing protein [Marivita sp.]|uniref:SH3 domain-containing protein n=1 Tax=Marivita sp. TaxID=2003365 RepID=UPI0025B8523F|nr:SH3 domain-containing protein [Marivita sp.]